LSLTIISGPSWPIGKSSNGRYLVDSTGAPWLMVGDSAHTIICNLPPSGVSAYLSDRKSRGFNAISIFGTDINGCRSYNGAAQDGTLPFTIGTSPSTYDLSAPNNNFWTKIDNV